MTDLIYPGPNIKVSSGDCSILRPYSLVYLNVIKRDFAGSSSFMVFLYYEEHPANVILRFKLQFPYKKQVQLYVEYSGDT